MNEDLDQTNLPTEFPEGPIYGTDNPIPDEPGSFIGTFQMPGGALVFHVFDLGFFAVEGLTLGKPTPRVTCGGH